MAVGIESSDLPQVTTDDSQPGPMTQSSAERFANIVMGAAAIGAAYYVLKTPRLRQVAWRLIGGAATGVIPVWIMREIRSSWEATAPQPVDLSRAPRARAV